MTSPKNGAGEVATLAAPESCPDSEKSSTPFDGLTLLYHPTACATKVWSLNEKGRPIPTPYGEGKYFTTEEYSFQDFAGFVELLTHLANEPQIFAIRGRMIPGRDKEHIRRTIHAKDGDAPGFEEHPRRWALIDVDGAKVGRFDLGRTEDCDRSVEKLRTMLPAELRNVAMVWQLSSSAGMKPDLRVHLWFLLDRPMRSEDLKTWAENVNDAAGWKFVDPALFHAIQPHYVASPLFDVGVRDPVAKRCGVLAGSEFATLRRPDDRAWLKKLAPLRDPKHQGIREPLRNAAATYFCTHGHTADAGGLREAMREHRDMAEAYQGRSGDYSDEAIDELIETGRDYAARKAQIGDNLVKTDSGTLKGCDANINKIIQSSPDWHELLGYNDRTHRIVVTRTPPWRGVVGPYPRNLQETEAVPIATWFADEWHGMIAPIDAIRRCVAHAAKQNAFEPVRAYFDGLHWDEVPRLDTWLVKYTGAEATDYVRRVGRMWLISVIARTFNPGCQVDTVPVIEGPQGYYKSSLVRALAGDENFAAGKLQFKGDKDELMVIHGPMMFEIEELAGMSKRDVEDVKGFVSRREDRFRPPYAADTAEFKRTVVFVGTTNRSQYLADETGGRRWWPVKIGAINLAGVAEVRDQLWAEAVHRYHAKEPWWTSATDPDFVREQEDRYEPDVWTERVLAVLEQGGKYDGVLPSEGVVIAAGAPEVTVSEILCVAVKMRPKDQTRADSMRVAGILRKADWIASRDGNRRFYRRPKIPQMTPVTPVS
jgi:predicted P-loop ATPase